MAAPVWLLPLNVLAALLGAWAGYRLGRWLRQRRSRP